MVKWVCMYKRECNINAHMCACSSYQEEKINSKAISNLTEDMLSTHIAIIGDFVASCITFSYPNRVPAGNKYHVPISCTCFGKLSYNNSFFSLACI